MKRSGTEAGQEEFQAYDAYHYGYEAAPNGSEPYRANTGTASAMQAQPPFPTPPPRRLKTKRSPEEVRSMRERKLKVLLVFSLMCLLIASVILVTLQNSVYRLESVSVSGLEQIAPDSVVQTSGLALGQNTLEIKEEDVRRALEKDHRIVFLGMDKTSPSSIALRVRERKVVSVLLWCGFYYTLDNEGIVMDIFEERKNKPIGIPMVYFLEPRDMITGRKLMVSDAAQMDAYRDIISELTQQCYLDQVAEIHLTDTDNLYLITVDGAVVRLGDRTYMRAKIGAAWTYAAYLRQFGGFTGSLDVTIPEDAKYRIGK